MSRLALVVCYKIASFGAFDIKKPIRLGFAIAHDWYCSRSLVVGPECLCSLSNANAFFLHSFSFSCGSFRVSKIGRSQSYTKQARKALSILLVKPISSMPSLLKTKALTSNQTKALTRLIYITKRILVKQPFAFIEEI